MRLSELQRKDIININDGKRLGRIIDVEINSIDGTLSDLIIERNKYFRNIFNTESDVLIKFSQIKKMGEDVVLIDLT